MKRYILTAVLSALMCLPAFATEYKVGVKHAAPFVYEDGENLTGYSIDYIKEIMGEVDRDADLTFVKYHTVAELLDATKNGDVDFSISAISVNAEREKYVDFSHPYFTTNVAIAVPDSNDSFLSSILSLGMNLVFAIIGFVALMYAVGFLVDRIDGDLDITNAHEGAWWAVVTASTVGYGDLVPKTGKGRLFAATWIVICLFLVSLFTGYVSSLMTVDRLSETPVGLSDLNHKRVGVVMTTTSWKLALKNGIKHELVDSVQDGLNAIERGKLDAVVYDSAMLEYLAKDYPINVWPLVEQTEYYSIAFPPNSHELKEKVNIEILRHTDSILTHQLNNTYF